MRWRIVNPEHPRWASAHETCFPGVPPPPAHHTRWLATGPGGEVYAICSAAIAQPDYERAHALGGPVCYLSRAGVMPARRGQGLQRSAIRVRVAWARRRGAVACVSDTHPDNASSARNLTRGGFSQWSPTWQWAGRRWVYWIRRLAD